MDKEIQDKINIYRTKKSAEYIIFNYNNSNIKNNEIFDVAFMDLFREIIKQLVKDVGLISSIINNINNYLSRARDIKDKYRDERIDIINDIIRMVNTCSKDNYLELYREELAVRRNDDRYLNKYPDYIIESEIENVHLSIINDYFVLYSHSKLVSDETFISDYLSDLINNNIYYECINSILYDEPLIFKDLTFYNRMICVFNMNNELNNTDKRVIKLNKKLVKKISKEIKKV